MGIITDFLEPYFQEFKPTQGLILFIVIFVCLIRAVPTVLTTVLTHIQRMRELRNQHMRDSWAHEEALADDQLESRKLDIEENKARAEAERELLKTLLENGVQFDDLRSESSPHSPTQNVPPS